MKKNLACVLVVSTFSFSASAQDIALKRFRFDPLTENSLIESQLEPSVKAKKGNTLHLIQFNSTFSETFRTELEKKGVKLVRYIPDHTFIVKMDTSQIQEISKLYFVRWVGAFHPAYKLDASYSKTVRSAQSHRYSLVVTELDEKDSLLNDIKNVGGKIVNSNEGSILVEALLNTEQAEKLIHSSHLLWIERSTSAGLDMWDARIQGGANDLEPIPPGYTGLGVNGHIMEGINPAHPDFANKSTRRAPVPVNDGDSTWHGSCTYGQVFGDGTNNPKARGLLPDGQGYYTNYNFVYNSDPTSTGQGSRYELVSRLMKEHEVMFQTASWGYELTPDYTTRSAEMDHLIFELDIPITQSQSNWGTTQSRPQAWAKNIISVGAVKRNGNGTDPNSQFWGGGASIGPASDGRIKPDLVAYYNNILTADDNNGYTPSFGGTSGATPIVAGYMGLSLQMWTNGIFGNPITPGASRFENRPHAMTTKALLINTARQYTFSGLNHDLTRVHQGWGFPSVKDMYDRRGKMIIINETDVIKNQQKNVYDFKVESGETELKVTLAYKDPEATLPAQIHRINNLDLKLTAPNGTVYFGNRGLLEGNFSTPGGSPDPLNTVENVILKLPTPGQWKAEVIGANINTDAHRATTEVDAVYALVINGAKK